MGAPYTVEVGRAPDGDRTVVTVRGEIDIACTREVARRIGEQLEAGPVLLDLTGLTYMDSSGVRMLDRLVGDAERLGHELRLRPGLSASVTQILTLTGMLGVLPFEEAERRG